MGQSYLLGCPEGGDARLLDAVERVDTAMCKIRDGGKVRARDRIAVLAALNLAFDLGDRGEPLASTPLVNATPAPTASGMTHDGAASPALAALLHKLDEALNDDGRLI